MNLLDLAIDFILWVFSLGVVCIFYRMVVAEERKVGLMVSLLAQTDRDEFIRDIRELVSVYSPRILPGFSRERLFDEPQGDDENEYYNFFHYHVITTLTEQFKVRYSSAIVAMATIGAVMFIGGISILILGSPSFSLATILVILPLAIIIVALPILFSKFLRASRRQLDLLAKVDDRFTDIIRPDS